MNHATGTRCGHVAVIGAPNAGKSTLVNKLVGSKVSIVSPKVQTTRTRVLGIVMHDNAQIIFIDTPGIFEVGKKSKRLERAMVSSAWQSADEADAFLLVVDASKSDIDGNTQAILKTLSRQKHKPCFLVLNKIDKSKKEDLLKLAKMLDSKGNFAAVFMVSALKGDGTEDIINKLADYMPNGPWLYPEEQISDMPLRLLAAEITREKLFHNLHEEIPYALTVETTGWEKFRDGSIKIDQTIFVARESQRKIILGKEGSLIKRVGENARKELEEILEQKIHLKLFIKLNENWHEDPAHYHLWGLDHLA